MSTSFLFEEDRVSILKPEELDALLGAGWRHFGDHFFRYNLMVKDGGLKHVVPLRVRLDRFRWTRSLRRIADSNQDIRVQIQPANLSAEESHHLFRDHVRKFSDNVPESLYSFLGQPSQPYPCELLSVRGYLGEEMVTESFLDVGDCGVSSVYGMYSLAHEKRSLGWQTMIWEIEYAIREGKDYYYHGYCFLEPSFYDYKKRLPALEGYRWGLQAWKPFSPSGWGD